MRRLLPTVLVPLFALAAPLPAAAQSVAQLARSVATESAAKPDSSGAPTRNEIAPTDRQPSDTEYASLACIAGAAITGSATLLVGSVAIVATGGVATAAESAIAVPVLVGTVAAGCGVAQTMTPGILWLRRRGAELVDTLDKIKLPQPEIN